MVPISNYYLDSDDPTAKAPVIIDDPEDKEILKGDTKILEVRAPCIIHYFLCLCMHVDKSWIK